VQAIDVKILFYFVASVLLRSRKNSQLLWRVEVKLELKRSPVSLMKRSCS
jgi:hypothetical protein